MAGTFQLTYVPGYTLSDSSRCFSNSAFLTKTSARFPCSSSSLDHKLNVRLKCAPNNHRPFVCRASSGGSEQSKTLRERFEKWCQTQGVVYGGKEEWMKRFEIYKSNLQYIDSHNSLDLSSKLTDNRFADMTHDEFKALCPVMKICDEPEDQLQAEPEIVSEYEEERESDFDSEPGPVTAILEPESELQLNSYQEEEEDDVTLHVLSDDDDESLDEEAVEEAKTDEVH